MAFPQVNGTPSGGGVTSSDGTTTLPAGVVAGERLICEVWWDRASTDPATEATFTGTGWVKFAGQVADSNITYGAFYKEADGVDDAITLTLTGNSLAESGTYRIRRISGHDPAVAPAIAIFTSGDAGGPAEPINAPSLTAPWGSADNLFLWSAGWDNGTRLVSGYPTGYTLAQSESGATASASTGNATAARQVAAASDDPDSVTLSTGDQWIAVTMAIKPAGGGGGGATAVTLTGPSSGVVGVPSTNFTVGANGTITGTVTVTPSDGGDGGSFSPTSVAISSGTPTATFTYTPANVGAPTATISVTNDGGLTNPAGIDYTATAAPTGPTIDTQPSNATVTEPATATFTVAATTSGGALSYQWQRNPGGVGSWANVATGTGGTTASYTTAATTESGGDANNADQFRCLVTDDNGTTTSSAATLTVNAAASNNIRLQPSLDAEHGDYAAGRTVGRWWVLTSDLTAVAHTGTSVTTDASGRPVIDINGAAYNVGDRVPMMVSEWTTETEPLDRTTRGTPIIWALAEAQV